MISDDEVATPAKKRKYQAIIEDYNDDSEGTMV